MNTQINTELTSLTDEEILSVSGAGKLPGSLPMAEDMYGNKISMEEFMDRQLMAANTIDAQWIWDFNYDGHDKWEIPRR